MMTEFCFGNTGRVEDVLLDTFNDAFNNASNVASNNASDYLTVIKIYNLTVEQIHHNIEKYIKNMPLLVVTNDKDYKKYKYFEKTASKVIFIENYNNKKKHIIDMLTCVPAKTFIGSPGSTFSSGIIQWRHRCEVSSKPVYIYPYSGGGWSCPGELKWKL